MMVLNAPAFLPGTWMNPNKTNEAESTEKAIFKPGENVRVVLPEVYQVMSLVLILIEFRVQSSAGTAQSSLSS